MDKPPAGLRMSGASFWRSVNEAYDLDARDHPVLLELCRTLDEIDSLKATLDADGVMSEGSNGQPREHPAMAGLRAHRLTLDRLLVRLALPDEQGSTPLTVQQIRAKAANDAKWNAHRTEVGNRAGGA